MRRKKEKVLSLLMAAILAVTGTSGLWVKEAKADENDYTSVGQNIALNKTAIASSEETSSTTANLVTDGNTGAPQWASANMKDWGNAGNTSRDEDEQTPQWVQIDLGENVADVEVTQIKLWFNARVWPMEYQIYTSATSTLEENPADTSIDFAEETNWELVVSVDRPSSQAGAGGWVVNGENQNIANTEENSDTITTTSSPALAENVKLQRYVLVYFSKVNAQAPGNNINLREIQIFDNSVNVDMDAVIADVSLDVAETSVTVDTSALSSTVTDNTEFYIDGSDLENVVSNNGTISGYNIGERDVTMIVGVRDKADADSFAEKNVVVTIPDHKGNYPAEYFPSVDAEAQNDKPEVIPSLQEWYGYTGDFKLTETSKIVYNDAAGVGLADVAANMQTDLREISGLGLETAAGTSAGANDIYIESTVDDTYKVGDEGYLMVTDESGLKIYAPTYTGCLYGTITVEQILWQADDSRSVPMGITRDYPAYEVRGIMTDVARTPYRLQQLQDYTKVLLWYKLNEFHIHINDNDNCNVSQSVATHSGFHRLESDRFPSLVSEVKQTGVPSESLNADYYLNNEDYQGNPTYTKEQWIDLKSVCESKGINMITEIDLPGHALLYNKYAEENPDNIPELEGGVKYTAGGLSNNGGEELLDLTGENAERALWFAETLWDEYTEPDENGVSVISGDVVHIGADEYWDHSTPGIRDAFAEFADSLRQVIQGNLGEDTKIRMWGAGTSPYMFSTASTVLDDVDLPSNYQLDVWYHGYDNARLRTQEGFEVVNCRDAYMYGNPGRSGRDVPNAEYLFNEWNPTMFDDNTPTPGTGTNPLLGEPNLLGAKSVIWGDQSQEGMTERDVNQRVLRAASIVSEKTWGGTDASDTFDKFEQRAARLAEGPGTNIAMNVESASSLVLDYDFDNLSSDGTTVYDASGNGYNGTLNKAGTVKDGYLTFDGDTLLTTDLTTLSYPYTVAFNIRIDEAEGQANTTASSLFSGYDGQIQVAGTDDGSLSANVNYFSRDFNYNIPTDGTEVNVMLVGTFQGTKLYINGQLQTFLSQKTDADGLAGNVTSMYSSVLLPLEKIGEGLHAEIADIQVYNKALSAEEAVSYYTEDWQNTSVKTNVAQDSYAGGISRQTGNKGGYDNTNGRVRVAFKAVDGDAFTLTSNTTTDQNTSDIYSYWIGSIASSSLSLDLGEARTISEAQIQWRVGGIGNTFNILVSNDNETWTPVAEISNNTSQVTTVTFEPVEARYIKMQGISSNSGNGYFIQEFLVYENVDKAALAEVLEKAEQIVEAEGLGFGSDSELFNAVVQARAARNNGIISNSDMNAALERLNAALNAEEEKVTVTFETGGGTDIEPQTIASGTQAVEPDVPTKDGYVFDGWYTDAECTDRYDFSTLVTANLTLYAKWNEVLSPQPEDPQNPDQPGTGNTGGSDTGGTSSGENGTDGTDTGGDKAVETGDPAETAWIYLLLLAGTAAVLLKAMKKQRR